MVPIKVDILLPFFKGYAKQRLYVVPQKFLKDETDRCAQQSRTRKTKEMWERRN